MVTSALVSEPAKSSNRYFTLRATPPRLMSEGSAVAVPVSGRHACLGTSPGSTSSKSPKNPRISSAPRAVIGLPAFWYTYFARAAAALSGSSSSQMVVSTR